MTQTLVFNRVYLDEYAKMGSFVLQKVYQVPMGASRGEVWLLDSSPTLCPSPPTRITCCISIIPWVHDPLVFPSS